MSQPVKLSDELVLEARVTSAHAKRSIASQIEFWAGLGRAVEVLLRSPEIAGLQKAAKAVSLSTALARPGTAAGDAQVAAFIQSRPFPHYEPAPKAPGQLLRIDADGTRTIGRFVNRVFVATSASKRSSMKAVSNTSVVKARAKRRA